MSEKLLDHTVDVGNVRPQALELMLSILTLLGINFFLEQQEQKLKYSATTTQRREIERRLRAHAHGPAAPPFINTSALV